MTEKLEKLIALAVADGEVTERELEILKKKAAEEGVDEDELEMLLNTRIWERKEVLKKELENNITPPPVVEKATSNKEGDIKKCPSCGASVKSFQIKCDECGHEFRGTSANKITSQLKNELASIDKSKFEFDSDYNKALAFVVKNLPVSNNKEDLIEVLTFMSSKVIGSNSDDSNDMITAYHSKALEVVDKLLLMSDIEDSVRSHIKSIQEQMLQKRRKRSRNEVILYVIMTPVLLFVAYVAYAFIFTFFGFNFWPF
jgi:hypothetical protein